MANNTIPNKLPDLTYNDNFRDRWPGSDAAVGRRYNIKNIINSLINKININNKDTEYNKKYKSQDLSDFNTLLINDQPVVSSNKHFVNIPTNGHILVKILRSDARRYDDTEPQKHEEEKFKRKTKKRQQFEKRLQEKKNENIKNELEKQHARKVAELTEFFKTHYSSTNYLYDEMLRIIRTHTIKDSLRQMLDYLEAPNMKPLQNTVLKCFIEGMKSIKQPNDFWKNKKTNNLVINSFKDSQNDGVVRK